jgi:orotate phosphoribosyltransferase
MMNRDDLLDLFRRSGALLEGHFRLTSGLHSSGYLQCALVLQHPEHAEKLGRAIAERTRDLRATVVLSPALGGVVIGQEVGRALGIRAIFAERQDGALTLRRGFMLAETGRDRGGRPRRGCGDHRRSKRWTRGIRCTVCIIDERQSTDL